MNKSQAVARLAGPVLSAIGIGMLTSTEGYRQLAGQFISTYPYIYFSGVMMLVGGLAILNAHSQWTRDWRSLITLLGWVMTCIGFFRIIAPPFVAWIGGSVFVHSGFFIGVGVVVLSLGAFLTFKGYVA